MGKRRGSKKELKHTIITIKKPINQTKTSWVNRDEGGLINVIEGEGARIKREKQGKQ